MDDPTGFCLKCKKTVQIQNARPITMKNGKAAVTGICPCPHEVRIFKIGRSSTPSGT